MFLYLRIDRSFKYSFHYYLGFVLRDIYIIECNYINKIYKNVNISKKKIFFNTFITNMDENLLDLIKKINLQSKELYIINISTKNICLFLTDNPHYPKNCYR